MSRARDRAVQLVADIEQLEAQKAVLLTEKNRATAKIRRLTAAQPEPSLQEDQLRSAKAVELSLRAQLTHERGLVTSVKQVIADLEVELNSTQSISYVGGARAALAAIKDVLAP